MPRKNGVLTKSNPVKIQTDTLPRFGRFPTEPTARSTSYGRVVPGSDSRSAARAAHWLQVCNGLRRRQGVRAGAEARQWTTLLLCATTRGEFPGSHALSTRLHAACRRYSSPGTAGPPGDELPQQGGLQDLAASKFAFARTARRSRTERLMTQCQFLPSNHVNRVRVRAPFDGTARLDGYGIAVASTARRDGSLVRRMRRVPKAKTRQAGGDSTFDGDRRWNPFKTRPCLL
jgi:hypothetical protein